MENNISQKVEEVLNHTTPQVVKPGVMTMPKFPHKSFYQKRIFIVLALIVLLIVLTSIFTLFNVGRFKKPVPYVKKPLSEAEYNQLVDKLKQEGFFDTAQIEDKELKKLQAEFESHPEYQNPPITPASRESLSEMSGTTGVVQNK